MEDEKNTVDVHPSTKNLANNLSVLLSPEGIQQYLLGTKKDGRPRAAYDVVKDFVFDRDKKKKKKDKSKKKDNSSYSFYLDTKGKKKKKKKKDKHWYFEEF